METLNPIPGRIQYMNNEHATQKRQYHQTVALSESAVNDVVLFCDAPGAMFDIRTSYYW